MAVSLLGSYNQSPNSDLLEGLLHNLKMHHWQFLFKVIQQRLIKTLARVYRGCFYSIPEIAFKVSGTYFSEISSSHATLENGLLPSTTEINAPVGVNLNLQSGIMEDTIAFASMVTQNWDTYTRPVG